MASTLKPFNLASVGAALTTVYTCPGSTVAIVHNLILCNKGAADITADVQYTKAATAVATYLAKGLTIEVGTSVAILGDNNKQALNENDTIKVLCPTAASLDVTGAVLEQS